MISLDGLKILIVDDESFMRRTIRAVLRTVARMDVIEAEDGDLALILLEKAKPDVVLCDITMPRMGGLRFVELLRKHPEATMRDLPVIIVTGHADEATVVAAGSRRINGYLIKPVSSKKLSHQLRMVLPTHRVNPSL